LSSFKITLLHTCECGYDTCACWNHTLRVKIALKIVEITHARVKSTLCVLKSHSCVLKSQSGVCSGIYLKIGTHACKFHTQMCHFHTFAYRIFRHAYVSVFAIRHAIYYCVVSTFFWLCLESIANLYPVTASLARKRAFCKKLEIWVSQYRQL
jgi:hypothetical protein